MSQNFERELQQFIIKCCTLHLLHYIHLNNDMLAMLFSVPLFVCQFSPVYQTGNCERADQE